MTYKQYKELDNERQLAILRMRIEDWRHTFDWSKESMKSPTIAVSELPEDATELLKYMGVA